MRTSAVFANLEAGVKKAYIVQTMEENLKQVNKTPLPLHVLVLHEVFRSADENTAYANAPALKSIDGGKPLRPCPPHFDNHHLWIHPQLTK